MLMLAIYNFIYVFFYSSNPTSQWIENSKMHGAAYYLSMSPLTWHIKVSQKCIFHLASKLDIQRLNEIPYISLKFLHFPSHIRACVIGREIGFIKMASSTSIA